MSGNIWKLYVIKISKWLMLYMAIAVPFYESFGLSLQDILWLQGINALIVAIATVPTGYWADKIGRKYLITIGCVLSTISFIIFSIATGMPGFLLAQACLALGASCIDGADSALLYDTVHHLQRGHHYLKLEGRNLALGNFAEGLGGLIGGLLILGGNLRLPFMMQIIVTAVAIPIAWTLVESPADGQIHPKLRQLKAAVLNIFRRQPSLYAYILYSTLTSVMILLTAWAAQPIFASIHVPLAWYGITWAMLQWIIGLSAWLTYDFTKQRGQLGVLVLIAAGLGASIIIVSYMQTWWALAILALSYVARGMVNPLLKDYMNSLIPAQLRATMLSLRTMLTRFSFFLAGPLLGWVVDVYSLSTALLWCGGIFLIASCANLLWLRQLKLR